MFLSSNFSKKDTSEVSVGIGSISVILQNWENVSLLVESIQCRPILLFVGLKPGEVELKTKSYQTVKCIKFSVELEESAKLSKTDIL